MTSVFKDFRVPQGYNYGVARAVISSEAKVLFQAHVVAVRIHFLIAVESRVACFSKTPAGGDISDFQTFFEWTHLIKSNTLKIISLSVQFSCSIVSESLRPHGP